MMDEYVVGLFVGDGVAHRNKANRSYGVWIDQHVKNKDILENLRMEFLKDNLKFYWYKVPDNKIRILLYSKEKYLIIKQAKEDASKFFRKLNNKQKKKFIGGFFDAEGTVTDRLVVYNKDKQLLEEIKKFLKTLGIISYIYKFSKVFGLQIYRKVHVQIFMKNIKSVKLSRVIQPDKKRSRLQIRKD